MSAERDGYGTSAGYPPLPPGRHKLPPEYVDRYQRRRLLVAVSELAHEEGLAGVTVTGLASRARISRKTFYDYFADRDRCVDYAAEEAAGYLRDSTAQVEPERPADERIAARVDALLNAVAVEPKIAELALIHAPALGGQRGRRSQEVAMSTIAALLAEVGEGRPARGSETIASAIIGVIACRLRRGEAERIGELAEEIVRLARLPAVGVDRAAPGRPG